MEHPGLTYLMTVTHAAHFIQWEKNRKGKGSPSNTALDFMAVHVQEAMKPVEKPRP